VEIALEVANISDHVVLTLDINCNARHRGFIFAIQKPMLSSWPDLGIAQYYQFHIFIKVLHYTANPATLFIIVYVHCL
jgi:hypothetical protein